MTSSASRFVAAGAEGSIAATPAQIGGGDNEAREEC
jgi:hypothetical protein